MFEIENKIFIKDQSSNANKVKVLVFQRAKRRNDKFRSSEDDIVWLKLVWNSKILGNDRMYKNKKIPIFY